MEGGAALRLLRDAAAQGLLQVGTAVVVVLFVVGCGSGGVVTFFVCRVGVGWRGVEGE